jgi:hypothetical protein
VPWSALKLRRISAAAATSREGHRSSRSGRADLRLLGPLKGKRTVWATCLFVDQIADIAVLGQPDNQALEFRRRADEVIE